LVGVRQSLFNAVFLPRALHHILLLGIPTLLHTRRMLPTTGCGCGSGAGAGHSGLGGSVELLTGIVSKEGWIGLLAGDDEECNTAYTSSCFEISSSFITIYLFFFFIFQEPVRQPTSSCPRLRPSQPLAS
jgi:hypothetical protein